MKRQKKQKRRMIAAVLLLLVGMGTMAYAGNGLITTQSIYQEGNAAYEDLGNQVRNIAVEEALSEAPSEAPSQRSAQIYVPKLELDFEALKAVNEDAVAWLYCPDTVIDYPIMKANDYNYYLYRLPDGTKNANGSLFIDYNNAPDFSDPLTVIYGHHMKSGRMFGSLVGYKAQKYYDEHPYMYLYTKRGNYQIELMYGCVIGEKQWRERAFMYAKNVQSLLAYAEHSTTFESGIDYTQGDNVIALSTCSYEFDDARYVVLGILRPEFGG